MSLLLFNSWRAAHYATRLKHAASPLVACLLLSVLSNSYAAQREPARPNIVLILMDDMGWKDGGCFGSEFYRTPHIDRLASSGLRFTQAYASCAVCSPTRAALMTGKYPARLHLTDWIPGEGTPKQSRFLVPNWQQHLPLEEQTIAERLKRLGYATACIGKWHLGGANYYPRRQGFNVSIAAGATGQPGSYFWPYGAPGDSHRVPRLAEKGGKKGEYLTDRLTEEALKFMERNRRHPFFLYLAHYAVHSPLMAKQAFVEEYQQCPGAGGQSNAVYAAMLQSVDESVGRVMQKLADLHLSERTVVIITSDNGGAVHFGNPPATSNSPLRLGKGYPYEGGLRVPLIISVPGMRQPGATSDFPVISHDLFPTLLELAGAKPPSSGIDGKSLVPLLNGQTRLDRSELFWHYPHYWNGKGTTPYSIVRLGDWKLIRFYEYDREELYNLENDIGEEHDLAGANPEKRGELALRLDNWLKEVGAQLPVARPGK